MNNTLTLSGDGLTLQDAAEVLRGDVHRLEIMPFARQRVERSRQCLERLIATGQTIYGVNTGFGKLSNQRIADSDVLELQENLLRSHAVGMGQPLPEPICRLAWTLRIQALIKGFSGITPDLVDALVAAFNRGIIPVIPEQGSVGASGDLAPLAHMALVLIGEGEAKILRPTTGEVSRAMSSQTALKKAGLQPYQLQSKEGISLINGTQISCAILVDALVQAWNLARVADVTATMTLEATRSSLRPFDSRIHEARPHPGQQTVAANVRKLMVDSEILASHAHCAKVQDAYSIRCLPQVHGTMRDALDYITQVVEREMNSATDNPLVFVDTEEVISGGNFHAQPVALAADVLAAAMTDLSSITERRIENLVNPDLSGLPGFLTPHPGLNSGMMLVQVLAAALVSENKSLAHPASVDSIPTSANREDHVSMATHAARKARTIVQNVARVLACEALCAAQGLEFVKPLRPGRGVEAALQFVRERVRPLERDRALHGDLEELEKVIVGGAFLAAIHRVCDDLH